MELWKRENLWTSENDFYSSGNFISWVFVELPCRKGKYEFEKVPFWEKGSELRRDLNFSLGSTFFSEILGGSCEEVVTIKTEDCNSFLGYNFSPYGKPQFEA